jgi:hypothetical protein
LATALPLAFALSVGLGLWQTNGQLFRGGGLGLGFSFSDPFSVQVAYAGTCDTSANPPIGISPGVDDGNARLYYNTCAKTLRLYMAGAWQDIGSSLWELSVDKTKLYPTNYGTVSTGVGTNAPRSELEVKGQLVVDSSADATLFTGSAGRDVIIVNAATGAGNPDDLAVIKTLNTSGFGFYSAPLNGWANLVAARVSGSELCVPDNDPAHCITSWGDLTGGSAGTVWDSVDNTFPLSPLEADVRNINIIPGGNQATGGNVHVTRFLTVDAGVSIEGTNTTGLPWETDSYSYALSDLGCTGTVAQQQQKCLLKNFHSTPDGSMKIAMGDNGLTIKKTGSGSWLKVYPYQSSGALFGTVRSVWAPNSTTAYMASTSCERCIYRLVGNNWTPTATVTSLSVTTNDVKLWGWPKANGNVNCTGSEPCVIAMEKGTGGVPVMYRPSDNSWPGSSIANPGVGQVDMAGNKDGELYFATYVFGSGKVIKNIAYGKTQSLSIHFMNDLRIAMVPKAIAVDYYGGASCTTCVVIVGQHDGANIDATHPGANMLIGSNSTWVTPNLNIGGVNYGGSQFIFQSAWVGNSGGTIIVSGYDTTKTGNARNVVLLYQGGAWTKSSPDDVVGLPCTGATCPVYVVSGTYCTVAQDSSCTGSSVYSDIYAEQRADRIFLKTSQSKAGELFVKNDVTVENNSWGGSVGGSPGTNPPTGLIQTFTASNSSCPAGEYMVGVKFNAGAVVGLYCQKL